MANIGDGLESPNQHCRSTKGSNKVKIVTWKSHRAT